jgi:ribosome-associated protein
MRARRPPLDGDVAAAPAPVERPSKSQLKREMHALQQLGAELTELPPDRLAQLALPDRLRDAIDEYLRTRSHEGRRRQMQYIGKLMRHADAEALHEAVAEFRLGSARDTLKLHEAERWRAELVHGDGAIERWARAHPQSDLQQLLTLVRAARAESGAAAVDQRHALFQFIKPHLADTTDAP